MKVSGRMIYQIYTEITEENCTKLKEGIYGGFLSERQIKK